MPLQGVVLLYCFGCWVKSHPYRRWVKSHILLHCFGCWVKSHVLLHCFGCWVDRARRLHLIHIMLCVWSILAKHVVCKVRSLGRKPRQIVTSEGDIVFAMAVSAYPLIVMYDCDIQCVVGGPPWEEQTEATNRMLCTGFIPIIISLFPRTP